MSKQRTLIITGGDQSIHPVLDLTLKSKVEYAKRHDYDLLIQRAYSPLELNGLKINPDPVCIGFLRVVQAFEYAQHYDTVMWIDADAIITNESILIEDMVDDSTTVFVASYDWTVPKGVLSTNHTFSTGNFIVRATQYTEQFYQLFLSIASGFISDDAFVENEQHVLNSMFAHGDDTLKQCFSVLDHSFLNAVPESIATTETWKNNPHRIKDLQSPWTEDSFLAHITGCTTEDRVQLLQERFNKYI